MTSDLAKTWRCPICSAHLVRVGQPEVQITAPTVRGGELPVIVCEKGHYTQPQRIKVEPQNRNVVTAKVESLERIDEAVGAEGGFYIVRLRVSSPPNDGLYEIETALRSGEELRLVVWPR